MGPTRTASARKAVLYTRVSTGKQAASGLGLEAQIAASGKDAIDKRPGLQGVLAAAAKREDVVVVVYSLSRLSRRQSLTWELLDDRGAYRLQIESASEPFDTSTPMGRAMLGMLGVWSQLEADMCAERTSEALAARKARGLPLGAKPLVAERPEVVEIVKELYSSGDYTHASLAKDLNTRGIATMRGAKWHATTVARTLKQVAE